MIDEILEGTKLLLLFGVVSELVVLVAMIADLASGLYKSKMHGDFTRSELLKRTGYKFCLYEGSMVIALCVDVLVHFVHLYEIIGLPHVVWHLPLVSFGMAIFWCCVEYLSIREKAAQKVHSRIAKVEKLAATMFTKDELIKILYEAITKTQEKRDNSDEKDK